MKAETRNLNFDKFSNQIKKSESKRKRIKKTCQQTNTLTFSALRQSTQQMKSNLPVVPFGPSCKHCKLQSEE